MRDTQRSPTHDGRARDLQAAAVGRRGAAIITEYLIEEGVPFVFTLCGHGNVGMLDALFDHQDEISVVSVHHEAAAGFMADAYFRVAKRPAATLTSCGPGSANLPIAMANALMDSSAFLAITGNVPSVQFNRAAFQESGYHFQADFPSVVRPYVKRSFQATRVEQLPVALRESFVAMTTGAPGPVHLDVPLDVFVEELSSDSAKDLWHPTVSPRAAVAAEDLAGIVEILLDASRPLLLVGRAVEACDASSLVAELVAELGIPVAWTPDGKGCADPRLETSLGETGRNGTTAANRAAAAADVIIAVGASFDDRATSSWLPGVTFSIPPTHLVQVALDARELGRNFRPSIGVVAHPATFLSQLREALRAAQDPGPSATIASGTGSGARGSTGTVARLFTAWAPWRRQVAVWKAEWEAYLRSGGDPGVQPIRPARLLSELRRALPDEGILVCDVGLHHNWVVQRWPAHRPGSLVHSWGFGAMGFGVAGAVGAKLAAPTRPVVAIVGDGCFLMGPGPVATAVEYGIPVVWVIWNNRGFLSIRDIQRGYFGPGRTLATEFLKPTGDLYSADYGAMARAMGAGATTVQDPGDLGDALSSAIAAERPWVLDVAVARDEAPFASGSWELPPLPHPAPSPLASASRLPEPSGVMAPEPTSRPVPRAEKSAG